MKKETISAYKEMETTLGEEKAKAVANFTLSLFDEMFERYDAKWEARFQVLETKIDALEKSIENLKTTIYVVLPFVTALTIFIAEIVFRK
ncbi:hypothetical protein HRbin37_01634 [bacterium HR37]|nr:hypothetical protein HRbin37_01634 [bacterium HR37]